MSLTLTHASIWHRGGTGLRGRFKICWDLSHEGSNPSDATIMRRKYTDEQFIEAVKNSLSIAVF